jgi:RNA polymerase sigma-70 factor (ECF subfamily)
MHVSSQSLMQNPGLMEERLLALCRDGDREALARVYSDHEGAIYRYAFHMLGNREDAHDLRQETFLKAFQSIGRFRGECSIKTWLFTICTNLCRRHRSARRRRQELLSSALEDPVLRFEGLAGEREADSPLQALERAATIQIILTALQSLPANQREIIILREIEQLSYEQIARVIGCSAGSMRVTLYRARKRFVERAEALLKETDK